MPDITRAQGRVLHKAASGFVMISGGFSGVERLDCIADPKFDRRRHIDRLIVEKLLEGGIGANQYCLTNAGREALARLPKKWLEGYGND